MHKNSCIIDNIFMKRWCILTLFGLAIFFQSQPKTPLSDQLHISNLSCDLFSESIYHFRTGRERNISLRTRLKKTNSFNRWIQLLFLLLLL